MIIKKMRLIAKSDIPTLFLTFICIGIFIGHMLYISKTRQYPQWDEHHYVGLSRTFYSLLRSPSPDLWARLMKASDYRQPLYPLISAIVLTITGPEQSYFVSLLVNGIYFIVTLLAIYFIVKEFGNTRSAVLASLIFAGMGFPLFYMHFAYSETATTMWVSLSMLFLLKSNGFLNRRMSVYAALMFVGGSLTRWVAPIFISGAILWELSILVVSWKKERKSQKIIRLSNAFIFIILSVMLSLFLYYIPNISLFFDYVRRNSINSSAWVTAYKGIEYANPWSVKTLVYYLNIISQNTVFYFMLFLLGCGFCFFRITKYGGLLLSFMIPYIVFSAAFLWKDDRFIVPLYPIIAVLSGIWLTGIKAPRLYWTLFILISTFSVMSYFGCLWGIGIMGKQGLKDIVLPSFIQHPRRIYLTSMVWPPVKEYIHANSVVSIIAKDSREKPTKVSVLIVHEPLTNALYSIEHYLTNGVFLFSYVSSIGTFNMMDFLNKDYIIARNVSSPVDGVSSGCFHEILDVYPHAYQAIGEVIVPSDGSVVVIYRRNQIISPEMINRAGERPVRSKHEL
ncbi:MAG: hypothetical protein UV63_C0001G0053 [Microgenomates group bacterium GW2011_GWC1_43_11]|uniref:Uncharacterized protein n=2 Tax=Candidatus Gottesmaniibacteriota TaxID=1752720 RepID=A0A0G1IR65_9BACT|nr:MAG: hypothetical protein UV63_C0001G0053 [Microgenomates group bacterium GW2011_GWC1_43_11]KKT39142.1 MAG: hypothetical protein UW22_C0001G0053 [Candidatus Gottesmanbacteria bacterium GW2011_GWB1_44_11c]KKT61615.1 MAG: hypothetical protein UW52_C0001G0053 [Candidatus Gottesmanbacteria bacterium GW2011_GWA1_44_24b]